MKFAPLKSRISSVGRKLNSVTHNLYKKAMTDNHSQNYERVGTQLYKKREAHKAQANKFLGK